MPRKPEEIEAVGQDSFLDVITNVVGIMIILVVITGIRAGKAPPAAESTAVVHPSVPPAAAKYPTANNVVDPTELEKLRSKQAAARRELEALNAELRTAGRNNRALEEEVQKLDQTTAQLKQQFEITLARRSQFTSLLAEGELKLQSERARLSAEEQRDFDLQRQLAAARSEVAAATAALSQPVPTAAPPAVEIAAYATPLAKVVDGEEAHFQIKNGRIAYVPMDELIELAKKELKPQIDRANSITLLQELTGEEFRCGPRRGFELRYSLDILLDREQSRVKVALRRFELVPDQENLGETLEEARLPNSQFQRDIREFSPRNVTITLWTHPDSFAAYRAAQTLLQNQGYATAGRFLPPGTYIAGSPNGKKSLTQ
ncbi:MAG: hypothetical protein SFX18_11660 [Pirellulales bacterium]|nr:hypothetical protein [Pirellulales bacterium]